MVEGRILSQFNDTLWLLEDRVNQLYPGATFDGAVNCITYWAVKVKPTKEFKKVIAAGILSDSSFSLRVKTDGDFIPLMTWYPQDGWRWSG